MSQLLPLFLNLQGKKILLIGGGNVALEKLEKLLTLGADITIVTKDTNSKFKEAIKDHKNIKGFFQREVSLEDISKKYYLIISATNDSDLNRKLVKEANRKTILINSVDDVKNCDFFMTGTVTRGPIQIAISTQGNFPGLAKAIRLFFETAIPENHSGSFEHLALLRKKIKEKYSNAKERTGILKNIVKTIETQYLKLS